MNERATTISLHLSLHRENKGGFRCLRRGVTSDKTVRATREEKRANLFREGEARGGGGGGGGWVEGKKHAKRAVNNRRVWPTRSAACNRVFIARAPVVRCSSPRTTRDKS